MRYVSLAVVLAHLGLSACGQIAPGAAQRPAPEAPVPFQLGGGGGGSSAPSGLSSQPSSNGVEIKTDTQMKTEEIRGRNCAQFKTGCK